MDKPRGGSAGESTAKPSQEVRGRDVPHGSGVEKARLNVSATKPEPRPRPPSEPPRTPLAPSEPSPSDQTSKETRD